MLEVTESARSAIKSAIDGAGRPVAGLRIMVQCGGCAGLQYGMALELCRQDDDAVIGAGEVTVLIDPESQAHLTGTVVGFRQRPRRLGLRLQQPQRLQLLRPAEATDLAR